MQIADFFVVGNSRVVEVLYADGVRGACDLAGLVNVAPFEPELAVGGHALRWPDGTVLSAERLRHLCLDPPPAARPMSVAEFVRSDVRSGASWELHAGTPVPRTGGSARHGFMVAELVHRLHDPVERDGRFTLLTHTWVAGDPESQDCRVPDLVLRPRRRVCVDDPSCWVDDAVCALEVHEEATAHLEARRVEFMRSLPSVREIVIVENRGTWARMIRRTDTGWTDEQVGPDGLLMLTTVDWTWPLAGFRGAARD